mmetsp:Transcript_8799/g.20516  ORF Transcript_8799/g.20516 Transcript_8799/m.20516 type:complete len:100 (+) Transcript_8799:194-493(+)
MVTGVTAEARRLAVNALVEMANKSTEVMAALGDDPLAVSALKAFGEGAAGTLAGGAAEIVAEGDDSRGYEGDRLQKRALVLLGQFDGSTPPATKRTRKH